MAKFNTGQSFADGDTVTGAKLNNITSQLNIYTGVISEQTAMVATVSTADQLLIADTDNGDSGAANRVTVQKLLNDTLTGGTFTNANLSGQLTYGTATGNRTVSTSATITTGTITGLSTTTGTVATLNSTTGTITGLNSTTGTVATLNSTTGTITTGVIPTLTSITKITSGTGTAAVPAISPTGDANTGVFFPAADTIAFSDGGAEAMRIDSSGNVGIGTDSPTFFGSGSKVLDIVGLNSGVVRFERTNSTNPTNAYVGASNGAFLINSQTESPIIFYTYGTERLRIASAGQIGIGGVNYGTSGQVLTSAGTAAAPSWTTITTTPAAGSITFPMLSTSATEADNVEKRTAKAWVNFNGTGTVAIRGSFNVSSITDNNTGDYTVNFTTAMANANYAVSTALTRDATNNNFGHTLNPGEATSSFYATTFVRVYASYYSSAALYDMAYAHVTIFN